MPCLDGTCCCLSASAAGLAAGEAVGEEGEEGDDALFDVLVGCTRRRSDILGELTLTMALRTVTMALMTAMKQLVMAETRVLKHDATAPIVAVLVGCLCGLVVLFGAGFDSEAELSSGLWLALE